MRLAGYQPQYFPRLHYWARILDSDIFTVSDHVQFVKKHVYPPTPGRPKRGKSYQADTPIKTSQGIQVLAVPVKHQGLQPINETQVISNFAWYDTHCKAIAINYGKAPYSDLLVQQLTHLLSQRHDNLAQLNLKTILWAMRWISGRKETALEDLTLAAVNTELAAGQPFRLRQIVLKSEAGITPPDGKRDAVDWIIETCHLFGADEYYHGGTAAAVYLDPNRFAANGIRLHEQSWKCLTYRQQFLQIGFIPNLSIIDLLANEDTGRIHQLLHTPAFNTPA